MGVLQQSEVLIFDLGNVIINLADEQKWWREVFGGLFHQEALQELYEGGFFRYYEMGKLDNRSFLDKLESHLKPGFNREDITQAWIALLADIPPSRLNALYQLKQSHRLFLLSNTNDLHITHIIEGLHEVHGRNIFEEIFETCYYSHQMGLAKPDRYIYEAVIKKENLNPAKSLFLDDRIDNLQGAQSVGLNTLHIPKGADFHLLLISEDSGAA